MKKALILVVCAMLVSFTPAKKKKNSHYLSNQSPLVETPFTALPLGAIKPEGMLLEMLKIQRDGLTGHLDSIYEIVCGKENGWLGGIGDGWERGPYWLDGLVPLAYILDDEQLKSKAQEWVEWSIQNQREDGYFGPRPLPEGTPVIPGTQQGDREDWWPKMVMLKVLQQYYTATNDDRVIELMTRYFKYQLNNLPEYHLGHWSYWGNRRGGDNLQIVLWLYNITGDKDLLKLGELIHEQTFDWRNVFTNNTLRNANPYASIHCVNIAQGLKEPGIYYQLSKEDSDRKSVIEGLQALKDVHGFVNGMYGGDESLHGNDPTQGSELCSAVEMMYSFESLLPITGDVYYADYLEKIAYNVLPTQHDDKFLRKQYFQQVNQVKITDAYRHFDCDGYGRLVFGTSTGYPCCLTNMHQGWPKFVQNLWYASADNGLAALVYGPSTVKAKVGKGTLVEFQEETDYPFKERIFFTYKSNESCNFPLYLRIPEWCKKREIKINGKAIEISEDESIVRIERQWKKGDKLELYLPMEIQLSRWFEHSLGIERGPLVYALKIEEEWKEVKTKQWEHSFYEVLPKSPWNYGIPLDIVESKAFAVHVDENIPSMPWNLENTPIQIETIGRRIPYWELYENSAGKLPYASAWPHRELGTSRDKIILIPYGCSTLRIAQFPVTDRFNKK